MNLCTFIRMYGCMCVRMLAFAAREKLSNLLTVTVRMKLHSLYKYNLTHLFARLQHNLHTIANIISFVILTPHCHVENVSKCYFYFQFKIAI